MDRPVPAGRENPFLIQGSSDFPIGHTGLTHLEYLPHNSGGFPFNDQLVSVLLAFAVSIGSVGGKILAAFITGMSELNERIEGLDNGADDYLIKPFHIPELLAHIRALIRRPAEIRQEPCACFSDLSFNQTEHILSCGTSSLLLTSKESEVLSVFISHPQSLISREQRIYKIWGTDTDIVPGNVDNYISFLRKRLHEIGSGCKIKTVYGSGYKLEGKNAGAFI